jgi:sodium-dependent phosphate transporter
VANAIGPFAAIYMTWREKGVSKSVDLGDDAYWILAIGGVGIVAGLAIYGYNIIHTIGTKIAKITPSRGICIELGSAIVVITGSRYGWPLSTTHCQVGATTAVALMEGSKGLDWNILLKTCVGWVATLVIVGGITALLFAQGIHAPCA